MQYDHLEWLRDQAVVTATGHVHVHQEGVDLYADKIRYDLTAQDIQADGNVLWQNGGQEIQTRSLSYNLKTREGKATHIRTTSPPWIVTGDELLILPNKIVVKVAKATTCDYADAYTHFHMQADKISVYEDFLVAENVVIFIGKVPVFYFPFFIKNLHDIRTPFSLSTGQTDYLGNYLLFSTNYLFTPVNYGAAYGDYFFNKGIGFGIRHEIALNPYQVLSLYGYAIQEKDTQQFRWESHARSLWALSSNLQGRIEADIPGDGLFSYQYSVARRDPSLVSTIRQFDVSTTYTQPQYTLSLLARRQEFADFTDPLETHFKLQTQTLPSLTFTLFPQKLIGKNWLRYDLSLQGDHTF